MVELKDLMKQLEATAKTGDVDGAFNLMKAIKGAREAEKKVLYEATKAERQAWANLVQDTLGDVSILDHIDDTDLCVSGIGVGTDKFTLKISINSTKVANIVSPLLADLLTQAPATVKSFNYDTEGMVVNLGKSRGGGSGTTEGAKKWSDAGGNTFTLGEAFTSFATPEQIGEHDRQEPAWRKWQYKKNAVEAAGFTHNG